jgi:hypothetical protein
MVLCSAPPVAWRACVRWEGHSLGRLDASGVLVRRGWGAMVRRLRHPIRARAHRVPWLSFASTRQRLPGLSRKGTSASGDFKVTTQCAACPRSSKRCSHAGLSKEACCVISK